LVFESVDADGGSSDDVLVAEHIEGCLNPAFGDLSFFRGEGFRLAAPQVGVISG
jgi:hypothetical protein